MTRSQAIRLRAELIAALAWCDEALREVRRMRAQAAPNPHAAAQSEGSK